MRTILSSLTEKKEIKEMSGNRVFLAFSAICMSAAFCLADEAKSKDKAKSEPAGAPIEIKLTSKKEAYKLDLGGQSAEEFKKSLKDAEKTGKCPPVPAV